MTVTVLEAPTTGTAIHHPAVRPTHIVVLVSPFGGLGSCRKVVRQLTSSGAVVFTQEVESGSDPSGDDSATIGDMIWTISATVDRATATFPGLAVILVGHGSTANAALAFTELFPDECQGLVVTERSAA
jgi:hypothetical protein